MANLVKVNKNMAVPTENKIKLNILVIFPSLKNKIETQTKYVKFSMHKNISHSYVFPFCSIIFSNYSASSSFYLISDE